MSSLRFIWCSFFPLQLTWHCTGACSVAPLVQPVLKKLCHGHLTCCLWYIEWCLHRCFNLSPPVHPVPLDFLAPALHIAPVIGHRCIRGLPVRLVLSHRFNWCNCFCRTRPIQHFFEFFLRILLCLAFLLYTWDL